MTKDEFEKIVAEYPFVYADKYWTDCYYIPGYKLKILDIRAGGVWFGTYGGKTPFLKWKYITPNTVRNYLDKQKERYERKQLQIKKETVKNKLNKLKEDFK